MADQPVLPAPAPRADPSGAPAPNTSVPDAPASDAALVARVAGGDAEALGLLHDRYGADAHALARTVVGGSAGEADDVVAAAFVQLWRSAARYDAERGSVAAWVTAAVHERALERVGARPQGARAEEAAGEAGAADPAASGGAPPPVLRRRIVAVARAAAVADAYAAAQAAESASAQAVAPAAPWPYAEPAPFPQPAPPRAVRPGPPRRLTPWLAAAAATLLAAGLGAGWAREREVRLGERERSVRALQQLAADVTRRTGAVDSALAAARDSVFVTGIVTDVRAARLAPVAPAPVGPADASPGAPPGTPSSAAPKSAPKGAAKAAKGGPKGASRPEAAPPVGARLARPAWLLVDAARGVAVLSAASMPRPQPGRTYQLWAIAPGAPPASLGVFAPGAGGRVRVVVRVPNPRAVELAAVTDEPAGGSPLPTGEALLQGELGGA